MDDTYIHLIPIFRSVEVHEQNRLSFHIQLKECSSRLEEIEILLFRGIA